MDQKSSLKKVKDHKVQLCKFTLVIGTLPVNYVIRTSVYSHIQFGVSQTSHGNGCGGVPTNNN